MKKANNDHNDLFGGHTYAQKEHDATFLFEEFKRIIPSNEELCASAARKTLKGVQPDKLKSNFSEYFSQMNDSVYEEYKIAENAAGNILIEKLLAEGSDDKFDILNKFYMSIFQGRKSRAGGAFEYIIKEQFKALNYPFSSQVNVDGAKPDFVLPNEEHFIKQPLDCIIFTAKRTLRERWRQVVTEAAKGYGFFLATIDQKVTTQQIQQMQKHKVYMVVPKSLKENTEAYQKAYSVLSFEKFFTDHLDPAMQRWS